MERRGKSGRVGGGQRLDVIETREFESHAAHGSDSNFETLTGVDDAFE